MIRLVLFDIDGTLIRTGGAGVRAFMKAFEEQFSIRDGEDKLNFSGRTDRSLVREFFTIHGIEVSPKNFERFAVSYLFWLEKFLHEHKGSVCAGVTDFFDGLKSLPEPPLTGLLTGNLRRGAELKLRHYNLWHHFSFGGFADDNEDRDQIAAVAHQRGSQRLNRKLHGHEVLVVGDTHLDIRCARAIGAKVLAVATGTVTESELAAHNPDWLCRDLTEISVKDVCF